MSYEANVARIETTLGHVGGKVDDLHDKVDTLVDGLNAFKIEVTKGFGVTNAHIDRVDQKIASHMEDDTRRFGEQKQDIAEAKMVAHDAHEAAGARVVASPSKAHQAQTIGGAGVLAGFLTVILDWIAKHFRSGGG